jgi:hypothetical protein
MPYTERKQKGGGYSVSGPSGVHAKNTTKAKADAQMRLLRGVEHGQWRPTGNRNAMSRRLMGG